MKTSDKNIKMKFELTREEFKLLYYCVSFVYLNNEVNGVYNLLYRLNEMERKYKDKENTENENF